MSHTKIPQDELKIFESLKDVKVVFDVGSRDDVDYLILKPGIEFHAFEPNIVFFHELENNVGNTPNCYLNNFGAGDIEGKFEYNDGGQCIGKPDENGVTIKRLDEYIEEHGITQIDFLKMDVEGYEPNVIKGLGDKINICRYIQYEQGKSVASDFDRLLPETFDMYYVGYRNVLGVRKGEELPYIPSNPLEGGQGEKDESNYLKNK